MMNSFPYAKDEKHGRTLGAWGHTPQLPKYRGIELGNIAAGTGLIPTPLNTPKF